VDAQALAAWADVIAAAGVIASLVYVSRQIRASAEASLQAAGQEVLNGNRVLMGQLGSNVAVASIWRRGMVADPALTADELAQFHALLLQLAFDWHRVYHLDAPAPPATPPRATERSSATDCAAPPDTSSGRREPSPGRSWPDTDRGAASSSRLRGVVPA